MPGYRGGIQTETVQVACDLAKLHNAEIIEKKNPDKYDFSACNDSEWDSLNAKLTLLKNYMKARETFLKALTESVATMDGEIINPPAITYGAMNVAVSLK